MRYHALATDYDGTIARHGAVSASTVDALARFKESGRKLLLVTGRELPDLFSVFPQYNIFDRIVAENGALLYRPDTREEHLLSEAPPRAFADQLRQRGVSPLSVGHVIVATTEPNESVVLQTIRELGLELQVIFNKGAVMVLPSGVNKATGLTAALKELGLSPRNTIGVGDAENDHAFLDLCECSAAVANALPALKQRADLVLTRSHGDGVSELTDETVANDLQAMESKMTRHQIRIGSVAEDDVRLSPYSSALLVTGDERRSAAALTGLLERLAARCYQVCMIDPAGAAASLQTAVAFALKGEPLVLDPVIGALRGPQDNVVINLSTAREAERAAILTKLFSEVRVLRSRFGRPHWIVIRNADQLFHEPASFQGIAWPESTGLLLHAQRPGQVPRDLLMAVTSVLAVGEQPARLLREFSSALKCPEPSVSLSEPNTPLFWRCAEREAVALRSFTLESPLARDESACATHPFAQRGQVPLS